MRHRYSSDKLETSSMHLTALCRVNWQILAVCNGIIDTILFLTCAITHLCC